MVHPRLAWAAGTELLRKTFRDDTRPDSPAPWYELLEGTHWPDQVPPGNGPFYVPLWVIHDPQSGEGKALLARLRSAGLKEAVAHVACLPENNDYLATAQRVAAPYAWNVNPILYRCYLYPSLGARWKRPRRHFNTVRWRDPMLRGR